MCIYTYKYMYMYFKNACMFKALKRAIKAENICVLKSKRVVKKIEAYTLDHDHPCNTTMAEQYRFYYARE